MHACTDTKLLLNTNTLHKMATTRLPTCNRLVTGLRHSEQNLAQKPTAEQVNTYKRKLAAQCALPVSTSHTIQTSNASETKIGMCVYAVAKSLCFAHTKVPLFNLHTSSKVYPLQGLLNCKCGALLEGRGHIGACSSLPLHACSDASQRVHNVPEGRPSAVNQLQNESASSRSCQQQHIGLSACQALVPVIILLSEMRDHVLAVMTVTTTATHQALAG